MELLLLVLLVAVGVLVMKIIASKKAQNVAEAQWRNERQVLKQQQRMATEHQGEVADLMHVLAGLKQFEDVVDASAEAAKLRKEAEVHLVESQLKAKQLLSEAAITVEQLVQDAKNRANEINANVEAEAKARRIQIASALAEATGQADRIINEANRHASFVLNVDYHMVRRLFLQWLSASDTQGRLLRATMVEVGSLSARATRVFKKPLLLAIAESRATGHATTFVAANLLRPLISDALHGAGSWGITSKEVRQSLRLASPSIRSGAADFFRQAINGTDMEPEDAWIRLIQPVFQQAWPQE